MNLDVLFRVMYDEEREQFLFMLKQWEKEKNLNKTLIEINDFVELCPEMGKRLRNILLSQYSSRIQNGPRYGARYITDVKTYRDFFRLRGAGPAAWEELKPFLIKHKIINE